MADDRPLDELTDILADLESTLWFGLHYSTRAGDQQFQDLFTQHLRGLSEYRIRITTNVELWPRYEDLSANYFSALNARANWISQLIRRGDLYGGLYDLGAMYSTLPGDGTTTPINLPLPPKPER